MNQVNKPELWRSRYPVPAGNGHKYDRGSAVIYGAPELTGATRLAASACARMGAGLTTVLCTLETAVIYRSSLPAHIMVRDDLHWNDSRVSARAYGCGGLARGVKIKTSGAAVLDAQALLSLPEGLHENIVLTPHEGEFAKAFPAISGSREERAVKAAQATGAVVVLKGAKTVIVHPDGRVVVQGESSPYLASAGTGDVLAGMITGLLAQGMGGFDAACAAVWIHAQAGQKLGAGLVASDLPDIIPEIIKDFA